jgi:arylsulfatase A-like enzyme
MKLTRAFAAHSFIALSTIVLLAALLIAALGCHPQPAVTSAHQQTRPNIVFILADDLGYGDVGCYGQKQIHTPNIDRLAAQGVRFTQFYAGDTVCTPSRCCLMTGLHTGHCNERGNGDEDNPINRPTMPEVLKNAGYDTAAIGKWGIGEPAGPNVPWKVGFNFFYGYLDNVHAHNYYPTFLWRNDQKEKLPNIVPNEKPSGGGVSTNKAVYSNDLFADEAIKFLDAHKQGAPYFAHSVQPFFLYLPFTIPHANDEAAPHGTEVPDLGEYGDKDWPDVEKHFAAMVTRLDSYVGRVLDRLQANGLADNTLVVFTSDNGPHKEGGHDPAFFKSWGPLRGIKRDLTEGGIREPIIIRWPGHTHANTSSDYIGGFQDFLPTFAKVAGASAPGGIDGLNFTAAIDGNDASQPQHPYLYWEFYERRTSQAVRAGDWKAIRIPMSTGKVELYDLKTDLHEDHNVVAEHPDIVAKLTAMMDEAHTPHQVHSPSRRAQ